MFDAAVVVSLIFSLALLFSLSLSDIPPISDDVLLVCRFSCAIIVLQIFNRRRKKKKDEAFEARRLKRKEIVVHTYV